MRCLKSLRTTSIMSVGGRKKLCIDEICEGTHKANFERFEIEFFNELVHKLITEMTSRFLQVREFADLFGFLYGKKLFKDKKVNFEVSVKQLCQKYPVDFNKNALLSERNCIITNITPFLPNDSKMEDSGPLDLFMLMNLKVYFIMLKRLFALC